jgi:TRAP-type C4-dicarboxylate transport system substrate-binding protein
VLSDKGENGSRIELYLRNRTKEKFVKVYWRLIHTSPRRLAAWLVVALLVTGCESDSSVTIINLGGTATPNTPGEAIWLTFKHDAETASNGRLELRPLIYGQLGSEEQVLSGLRRGRIQFANLSAQVTSTIVPELSLLYAPYLFDSAAEADYIYDNYLTDIFRDLLAARNLHLVTWYEIGFHSVYAKEPLILPADANGRRFRVSNSLNARLFAESIGADVIPLGFGEIVSGLQTGLIEAGENSISLYARTGISDEAPHFTMTRHAYGISVILTKKDWWDGLAENNRRILKKSFPSVEKSRSATRAQNVLDLEDPQLEIRIHELNAVQQQEWRQRSAAVTELLLTTIGGRAREIYDLILQGQAEYRKTD